MSTFHDQAIQLQKARSDLRITVRRQPNDWRQAVYRLGTITWFRFDSVSGGVMNETDTLIWCNAWCDGMESGEIAHSCQHGPAPHEVKVCILESDNDPPVFSVVRQLAELDQEHRREIAAASAAAIRRITGGE